MARLGQFRNNRPSSFGNLTNLDGDFRVKRKEDVYTRAELDEAKFLTLLDLLSFVDVPLDAKVTVKIGEITKGGRTIIAELP